MLNGKQTSVKLKPTGVEVRRQTILVNKHGEKVPVSQVMPKYIPKEPTKVSSLAD